MGLQEDDRAATKRRVGCVRRRFPDLRECEANRGEPLVVVAQVRRRTARLLEDLANQTSITAFPLALAQFIEEE